MKISGRPEILMWPFADSSAQYSPICVEGVIGYAPAASVDSRSHIITAVLPSTACRIPGYRNSRCVLMLSVHLDPSVTCMTSSRFRHRQLRECDRQRRLARDL